MVRRRFGEIITVADAAEPRRFLWVLCKSFRHASRLDPRHIPRLLRKCVYNAQRREAWVVNYVPPDQESGERRLKDIRDGWYCPGSGQRGLRKADYMQLLRQALGPV